MTRRPLWPAERRKRDRDINARMDLMARAFRAGLEARRQANAWDDDEGLGRHEMAPTR